MRPRKPCKFCVEKGLKIDYKDTNLLRGFLTENGKIWGSRTTGICAGHQRILTTAIHRARMMALLPFTLR